jgi:hypothetical protein
MAINIKLQSGSAFRDQNSYAQVYDDKKLVAELTAKLSYGMGADGGRYPYVEITMQKPEKKTAVKKT